MLSQIHCWSLVVLPFFLSDLPNAAFVYLKIPGEPLWLNLFGIVKIFQSQPIVKGRPESAPGSLQCTGSYPYYIE